MLKTLLKSVRQYKKETLLSPLCVVVEVFIEMYIPYIMGLLIDNGINKGDMDYVRKMGLFTILLTLVSLVLGASASYFSAYAAAGFTANLRQDMFYHMQDFSFENIDKFSSASLVTRLTTDTNNIQQAYQMSIRMAVRAPFMMIISLVMAVSISWRLTLVFLVAVPVLALAMILIIKNARPYFPRIFRAYDELNRKVSERAKERGAKLQAHMNEYAGEVNFFLTNKQMRPFEYLDSIGALDGDFIAAHCLLLSEHEKELLAEREVKICHCPFSNCGKGAPDTPSLQARGICVGLGTDGAAHGGLSLWNEMKIFRSVMNVEYGSRLNEPAVMPAREILRMATENGYRLMGEDGGVIAPGKQADLITIHLMQPHLYPTGNLVITLLECVTAGDVCDNIVNGKILMRDREVLTLDEEKIMKEAAEL